MQDQLVIIHQDFPSLDQSLHLKTLGVIQKSDRAWINWKGTNTPPFNDFKRRWSGLDYEYLCDAYPLSIIAHILQCDMPKYDCCCTGDITGCTGWLILDPAKTGIAYKHLVHACADQVIYLLASGKLSLNDCNNRIKELAPNF